MRRTLLATSAAIAVWITACGALGPIASPVASEARVVSATTDTAKTLTVKDGLVFYDGANASHGIRFPPGTYALEAQDASYWYLRAPGPLERREFNSGKVSDSRTFPGGIMIGKSMVKTLTLPAAGYADGENGGKVLIWRLGGEFVRLEGRDWSKSF